jgi:hypothetical protein
MNLEKEDKIISDKLNEYIAFDAFDKHKVWGQIEGQLSRNKQKKHNLIKYISVAALLILFLGGYFITIQSNNPLQGGVNKGQLVKDASKLTESNSSVKNIAEASNIIAIKETNINVKQTPKEVLNNSKNTTADSSPSTNLNVRASVLDKTNTVVLNEIQASIHSDIKASSPSVLPLIVNAKINVPMRRYSIVHINELGHSDEVNNLNATIAYEKPPNTSIQLNSFNEQQDVQKYFTIKLISNKSNNSINNDHEK